MCCAGAVYMCVVRRVCGLCVLCVLCVECACRVCCVVCVECVLCACCACVLCVSRVLRAASVAPAALTCPPCPQSCCVLPWHRAFRGPGQLCTAVRPPCSPRPGTALPGAARLVELLTHRGQLGLPGGRRRRTRTRVFTAGEHRSPFRGVSD